MILVSVSTMVSVLISVLFTSQVSVSVSTLVSVLISVLFTSQYIDSREYSYSDL